MQLRSSFFWNVEQRIGSSLLLLLPLLPLPPLLLIHQHYHYNYYCYHHYYWSANTTITTTTTTTTTTATTTTNHPTDQSTPLNIPGEPRPQLTHSFTYSLSKSLVQQALCEAVAHLLKKLLHFYGTRKFTNTHPWSPVSEQYTVAK
jgi:hypothetical protein